MYGATLRQAQPWIAAFRTRLDDMVRQLRQKFPGGCEIFIADIYDPTDGEGVTWNLPLPAWKDSQEILRLYNQAIYDLCQSNPDVHLVRLHDTFLGHGFACRKFWRTCYRGDDPTYWYAGNIEDPNLRGYDAIRRVFLLGIADVMRK